MMLTEVSFSDVGAKSDSVADSRLQANPPRLRNTERGKKRNQDFGPNPTIIESDHRLNRLSSASFRYIRAHLSAALQPMSRLPSLAFAVADRWFGLRSV